MVGLGLAEAMPMPFLAPGALARCGLAEEGIELANPLVAEEAILRTSLLPGLVQAIGHNATRRQSGVGLFEIGRVFLPPAAGQLLPNEREMLGVARSGLDASGAVQTWNAVVDTLALRGSVLRNEAVPGLHPTRSARIFVGEQCIGALGEIDPAVTAALDIGERVAWLEVDLSALAELPYGDRPYRRVSRFPSSDIDLAFDVADEVPVDEVERAIWLAAADLVWSVELFDVFRGEALGEGRRSLAFALRLQATDRTLTDAEVQQARQVIIAEVQKIRDTRLRG